MSHLIAMVTVVAEAEVAEVPVVVPEVPVAVVVPEVPVPGPVLC